MYRPIQPTSDIDKKGSLNKGHFNTCYIIWRLICYQYRNVDVITLLEASSISLSP